MDAYIVDGVRTPFARFAGSLCDVRTDDLAASIIASLLARQPQLDSGHIDEVFMGCANQAGEDNRNVARMAALLAGLPVSIPGVTVNRLCASGLEAVIQAARGIHAGDMQLAIAGGVESMSRSPYVMAKPDSAFARNCGLEDTTIGWRLINPRMRKLYGVESNPETAENLARELNISREDQDAYAWRSQQRTAEALASGYFADEIVAVTRQGKRGEQLASSHDEHPRPEATLEGLAALKPIVHPAGTVTAGNASGINDGSCALLLASAQALQQHGLQPLARVIGAASAGVEPRVMGIGPVPAIRQLLQRFRLTMQDIDLLEINEAFAAQVLACTRELGLPDDSRKVNPNGGAIALGHPLGASGARLVLSAARELQRRQGRYTIVSLCVGVGQGLALLMERC
ncbi:3-oxoadipyl-CoA thiolase [Vogesella oryzae]|uniref:3-oxoadipyl-CoA thiolase n=1 Tax=Vogesella oryzae TaxID=1735285 RepID=UPI0015828B99|nr:3-oxoadipyl-CoA thiolase [Vogesella oryzae]